eukprot:m.14582 g.14582  ORF g.14582 m.14582 type:complete len:136 (+) comp7168_c0_seq1:101-508(+)
MFRAVTRVATQTARTVRVQQQVAPAFVAKRFYSAELSDAEFDSKWEAYFEDVSLTQREIRSGLNDLFAHDAVPSRVVLQAAFRATRRVNDFPTSVRIFEGIKDKCQSDDLYKQQIAGLQPIIQELQLATPEDLKL